LAEELANNGAYKAVITEEFLESFYRATPLHDIGKVAIDDAILRKPGPLTPDEFQAMQKHTIVGDELLRSAARILPTAKYLEMAADIARHHHERFDGRGYPDQLCRTNIPLAARILCVADVFDALTSKRVYKEAVSVSEAARIILAETARQFDPLIIEAFEARLDDMRHAHSRFASNFPIYGTSTPGAAVLNDGRLNEWCLEPSKGSNANCNNTVLVD
jgi:putative two-component system response regulator